MQLYKHKQISTEAFKTTLIDREWAYSLKMQRSSVKR